MSFHETRFPTDIGLGSAGGPGFDTNVIATDSGVEQRVARLAKPRGRWNAGYGIRTHDQLAIVRTFYIARQGVAYGFRFKDWADYATTVHHRTYDTAEITSDTDVLIGAGDGVKKTFQLVKTYTEAAVTRTRTITKPVAGKVKVSLDDVPQPTGWTVDSTTGILTFTAAPGAGVSVKAGFEFDVPVRFGEEVDDVLSASIDSFSSGGILDIPLVEIVDPQPISGEFFFGGATYFGNMSASISISLLSGRAITLDPTTSGLQVFLPPIYPAIDGAPLGGPHFYIRNDSATDAVSIRTGCDVEVVLLAALATVQIWLAIDNLGLGKWVALQ